MAQRAMGAIDAPIIEDRPLNAYEVLLLIITEVILTPLVGLALWHGLRERRPRAARLVARIDPHHRNPGPHLAARST